MTFPLLRLMIAVVAIVGILGGAMIVSADAGDGERTALEWMHDGVGDHVHDDYTNGQNHGEHVGEHDHADHGQHMTDHDHGEHHQDGGHCDR